MKIIENQQDILPSALQRARIFMAIHPLARLHRKTAKKISFTEPTSVQLIRSELTGDYISIDCAGWYFQSQQQNNIAVEVDELSKLQKPHADILPNYYEFRPDYLPNLPILCYHSNKFRYSTLEGLANFFNVWGPDHGKYIVGLDSTKIKYNYLKYSLIEKLSPLILWPHTIQIISADVFDLLFVIQAI